MVDLKRVNIKKNRLRIGFLLAFIFSLVGGIFLFAFNFLEYYKRTSTWDAWLGYYVVEYTYGKADISTGIYGPLIALSGIFLFIATFISLVGMYNPQFVNKKTFALGSFNGIFVFLLTAIGMGIASSELSDQSDWWPELGFYGGIIGGLITFIFFGLVYWGSKKMSAQEYAPSKSITPEKVAPEGVHCHKCGKEVSGQFCTYCGAKIRVIQEYQTP